MKNSYKEFMTREYLMGPDCLCLLDELLELVPGAVMGRVLDLGCGRAITSLFTARETDCRTVWAADLWISATENYRRICSWGEEERIIPVHSDAKDLPFAEGYFDAVVSLDAFHYFGCEDGFFARRILPLIKSGGCALIAVPGVKKEMTDGVPGLIYEWAEEDSRAFHSAQWWSEHIAMDADGIEVAVRSSERFEEAWQTWFASGHEYAQVDKEFMDRGLRDLLDFVLIVVRKA